MSIYNLEYEMRLFDIRKPKKVSNKLEFSYVANYEVVPNTPISYISENSTQAKTDYIFGFLEEI